MAGVRTMFPATGLGNALRLRGARPGRESGLRVCATVSLPSPTPISDAKIKSIKAQLELVAPLGLPVVEEAEETGLQVFWRKYNQLLEEKPILVKSLTSLFGFMIGDICAQSIVGGDYDVYRTMRLTLFGILMDGPIGEWGLG